MTRKTRNKPELTVNCPQCNKLIAWDSGNVYRPFCSERCKLIDLGQWASGSYRVAASPDLSPSDDSEA